METKQNFEVEISKELNDKIFWIVNNYEKEIGAWLIGEITKDKIIIEDFLIPFQDVSNVSVDTSGSALVKLRKEYGDKCKRIIGHFHSHNTMSSYWSSTDEDFINEFIAPREKAVFMVASKGDKYTIRLELNNPIRLSLDELDYCVIDEDSEIATALKKEIELKVKETKIAFSNEKENSFFYESKSTALTRKQINKMITFNNKDNSVYIRKLSLLHFYQLDDVFPFENEVIDTGNGEVMIKYQTKDKKEAIDLMRDLRDFMFNDIKEIDDDLRDFEQNGISDLEYQGLGGTY